MHISEVIQGWLGWCPNAPVIQTAPADLVIPSATAHPAQPGSGANDGGQGRIQRGLSIATGSIRAMFRERHLLWFSLIAGIVILFLIVAEGWSVTHYALIPLPYTIWIPFGNSSLIVFNLQLFLIEGFCMSCFTLLLAGLILYRTGSSEKKPVTIREAFDRVNTHAIPLATLSITMAFVATLVFELVSQSQFIGKIIFNIDMTLFYLPYAYYVPNGVSTALFFSFEIMIINIVLFLMALYVVPGIVLESKRLLPALAGSVTLMTKTWREMLGCILVFGTIILGVLGIALVIGQSPLLLSHDYDFFLQFYRGKVLMTVACYGFLLACGVLMAIGSTVIGIAIAELYRIGESKTIAG